MAHLKKYVSSDNYESFKSRYKECIRMLNGLEKSLERHLPESDRRWTSALREENSEYSAAPTGYPPPEH
jgi:hypothetical protein